MITSKTYKQIIIFGLVFLVFIGQEVVLASVMNTEFSAEKEKIVGHSRVLFGYNATLIENSDVNIDCWVILTDQGDYNVVWEGVRVAYVIKSLDEHKEDKNEVLLVEMSKVNKPITITTGYDNLVEGSLHLKITFYFHEANNGEDAVKSSFTKSWDRSE